MSDHKPEPRLSPSNDRPVAVTVEKGKTYLWCSCGKTQTAPFCDGSHQGTRYQPYKFTATESKTEHLCGCSGTGNKPFCDGTHQFKFGGGRDDYYRRYD